METKIVSDSPDALLSLIEVVKLSYKTPSERRLKCGVKPFFNELSFLLLAVVAVVTKTFSDPEPHRLEAGRCGTSKSLSLPEFHTELQSCVS
ncbi:MAG: hypothetical protein M3Q99_06815 [Acidobacteriota bacterium]|nr:hypothetical protein [Acidobacteriota bacterium]